MSTPRTHRVAETKERSYLSNQRSDVCVSGGCIWVGFFLQMHLRFGFVFGHLHKTRGRTSLKRLALQSGKQRFLIIISHNSLGRSQFPRQRQYTVCACTGGGSTEMSKQRTASCPEPRVLEHAVPAVGKLCSFPARPELPLASTFPASPPPPSCTGHLDRTLFWMGFKRPFKAVEFFLYSCNVLVKLV